MGEMEAARWAGIMAAAKAVHDTLKALRDGVEPGALKGVPDGAFMARAVRDADYRQWSKDFLGAD